MKVDAMLDYYSALSWQSNTKFQVTDPLITVFTPAYNRDKYLPRLYESLVRQKMNKYEWLIVDDGSTDSTANLLESLRLADEIPMAYCCVHNGGKSRGINRGIVKARGQLFFIVDSDDYITNDALESIENEAGKILKGREYAGLCFLKGLHPSMEIIGKPFVNNQVDWRGPLSRIEQDKAEVFFTKVLRDYPFPEIPGEKFVPESFVWDEATSRYPARLFNKVIYVCEYLDSGLSRNFMKNLSRNRYGFLLYYWKVATGREYSIIKKIKAILRVIQIYFLSAYTPNGDE